MCLPLVVGAQPHKGVKAIKALSSPQVERTVLHATPWTWQHPQNTQSFLQLLSRATPPLGQPRLHKDIVLNTQQRQIWLTNYQKILTDFEQFKKDSFSFLFYQSIPLEKHQLSTEEHRQWLNKMLPLYNRTLNFYLTTNAQDNALQYVLAYMGNAISILDPYLVPVLRLNAQPLIAPFNAQDFFLYSPENTPLGDPSITLDGKKIAIINDDKALLDRFEQLSNMGILFPGTDIHTNGSPFQFLLWFQNVSPKPDIVFTDIQLGQANGYYIAHLLRESGYKGGIIALTSYAETETNARQLKAAGFDGMISLDERYWKMPIFKRITQAAQVYLERKKLDNP